MWADLSFRRVGRLRECPRLPTVMRQGDFPLHLSVNSENVLLKMKG